MRQVTPLQSIKKLLLGYKIRIVFQIKENLNGTYLL